MSIFSFSKKETVELVEFINRFANRSKRPRAYKRKFRALAEKIKRFEQYRGETLYSNSFSYQTFEDFIYYLKSEYPYRVSTLEGLKASLTVIIHRAEKDGYKVNFDFSEFKFQKEERTAVFLSPEELIRLFSLDLSAELSVIRDIFLIGCWTGLRFADYTSLTIRNIIDNTIQIRTKKTGARVVIPIHAMIRQILARNENSFPVLACSQQYFNFAIKKICRKAGIDSLVLVERMEGSKPVKKALKKYELVASHTARRSFATNMYLAGIATAKIMLLTGHVTEEAFFRYIRIGKIENARELGEHVFFKWEEAAN